MNLRKRFFIVAFAIVFVGVLILYSRHVFEEIVHKDDIVYTIEELSEEIDKAVMEGKETFTFYLKDISTDSLNELNKNYDGLFYVVDSYNVKKTISKDIVKVSFNVKVSENYFVYMKYVYGNELPNDDRTIELYNIVDQAMNSCINITMTDYEKEMAIHNYIINACSYAKDTSNEDIYNAYGCLVNGEAVCQGYSQAFELLLRIAGIDSIMIFGEARLDSHAWNMVNVDNKWYHVDVTWDDKDEYISYAYFNVDDDIIKLSHSFSDNIYPIAKSLDDNYFSKNSLYFSSYEDFKQYVNDKLSARETYIVVAVSDYDKIKYDMNFMIDSELPVSQVKWKIDGDDMYTVIEIYPEYK